MRCETCGGRGTVVMRRVGRAERQPCPDCGGCGIAHCRDGLREPITDRAEANDDRP